MAGMAGEPRTPPSPRHATVGRNQADGLMWLTQGFHTENIPTQASHYSWKNKTRSSDNLELPFATPASLIYTDSVAPEHWGFNLHHPAELPLPATQTPQGTGLVPSPNLSPSPESPLSPPHSRVALVLPGWEGRRPAARLEEVT